MAVRRIHAKLRTIRSAREPAGLTAGIGLGYDEWFLAVRSGLGTAFIIEARVWSYPYRPQKTLARYRRGVFEEVRLSPFGLSASF